MEPQTVNEDDWRASWCQVAPTLGAGSRRVQVKIHGACDGEMVSM
jgi:hypothetical protein